jgi:threonine dehydratase
VVAGSSGNHGHGVALAASLLGTTAVAVLPSDAPAAKHAVVRRLGATVVSYDRFTDDRDVIVDRIASEERRTAIPSADSATVMAGAGTIALELVRQCGDLDVLVVPVGGGGLAAGCAAAAVQLCRSVQVVGVEPRSGDDTLRSLAAGRRVLIEPPTTIADGLCHRTPAGLAFRLNQRLLDRVVLVSDTEIVDAMRFLFEVEGMLIEPSGACALAAVLAGRVPLPPRARVGVVVSGGNIDPDHARHLIQTMASTNAGVVR